MPTIRDHAGLRAATQSFLRRRSWLNPDLRLLRWEGDALAVAKDWSEAPAPLRLYGRWVLAREWRMLEHLRGIDGIPEPLVRLPNALVMTFLDGDTLSSRVASRVSGPYFDELASIVAALHRAGVVHLDLRQRRNTLLGPDGRPRVLDFGAALRTGRLGWLGRPLHRLLCAVDRMAVLKLKAKYAPEALTDDERARARWARRLRYAWPPNWVHGIKTRLRRRARSD